MTQRLFGITGCCFCAGERLGSGGLREDRRSTDHDWTGPSVPEPLPNAWLHLQGPRPLKLHQQHYDRLTSWKPPLNPVRDNPVKTNDTCFLFKQKCTAKDAHRMALFSVSSKVLTSRVVLSFVGLACVLLIQAAWKKKKELYLTGMKKSTCCSALVRNIKSSCTYTSL